MLGSPVVGESLELDVQTLTRDPKHHEVVNLDQDHGIFEILEIDEIPKHPNGEAPATVLHIRSSMKHHNIPEARSIASADDNSTIEILVSNKVHGQGIFDEQTETAELS